MSNVALDYLIHYRIMERKHWKESRFCSSKVVVEVISIGWQRKEVGKTVKSDGMSEINLFLFALNLVKVLSESVGGRSFES